MNDLSSSPSTSNPYLRTFSAFLLMFFLPFIFTFCSRQSSQSILQKKGTLVTMQQSDYQTLLPEFSPIQNNLHQHLFQLTSVIGERSVFQPEQLQKAKEYILSQFKKLSLTTWEQTYTFEKIPVSNIISFIPGKSSPQRKEKDIYYVLGAHYDSVWGTPGADDNASGVATLLELARLLGKENPGPPLLLVAFTLEEPPAFSTDDQGSRYFLRHLSSLTQQLQLQGTLGGAIILEMVGYTSSKQEYPFPLSLMGYPIKGNYIAVVGNGKSRTLGQKVIQGLKMNPSLPVESLFTPLDGHLLPLVRLSDHASFWDAHYPAVMITDTAYLRNPHYHQNSDTMETLDLPFMTQLVLGLYQSISFL